MLCVGYKSVYGWNPTTPGVLIFKGQPPDKQVKGSLVSTNMLCDPNDRT